MQLFFRDSADMQKCFEGTTDLCISAHEDDVELMALAVIGSCIDNPDRNFSACVLTDGANSPRTGAYEYTTNEEMVALRLEEQKAAMRVGKYNVLAMLGMSSADVKGFTGKSAQIEEELKELILKTKPEVIYTHNMLDRHPTHIGAFKRTLNAILSLDPADRPKRFIGCEVWGSLDLLKSEDKILVDSTKGVELAHDILGVFESQIAGGKSYEDAWVGRQKANATFSESHACDEFKNASVYIDMTPLIDDRQVEPAKLASELMGKLWSEILENLS